MKDLRLSDEHGGGDRAKAAELSASDSLFAMLDGQIIRGRAGAWRAEVVSILTERGSTWVQVGQAGRPSNSVVLRMSETRLADAAIAALQAWTDLPEESRPARIDVRDREPLYSAWCSGLDTCDVASLQSRIDRLHVEQVDAGHLSAYIRRLQSRATRH